jgi:phosphoribosylformylglycinamidine synthase I
MKFGVVVFPGTWSDVDCFHVLNDIFHQQVEYLWHKESDLSSYDCVILPGGFSYGDYLRPGAIARFSPIMQAVEEFAERGKLVLGICNGFQILCEAGLLPGVLMPNAHLEFRCQWVNLRVEDDSTPFTNTATTGQVLRVPISHGEGNYFADESTIRELNTSNRVIFRYCAPDGDIIQEANPNGSLGNIAGITNAGGNVLGMMPHPERCCEELIGGTDGRTIFKSVINAVLSASMKSQGVLPL